MHPRPFLQSQVYRAPQWAQKLKMRPKRRLCLGHFPTPIFPFSPPGLPDGVKMFIKREDYSGMETGGNKVRKLEFILQDALDKGCDSVVTLGGLQSNHCRATAAAASMIGLDTYLVFRAQKEVDRVDLVGNVLLDRMLGAKALMIDVNECFKHGSLSVLQEAVRRLRAEGRKPYLIPVGGSDALGMWGYIDAAGEILGQEAQVNGTADEINERTTFTDVAVACGSGATAAGVALGLRLGGSKAKVHAYGVCDSPEYFHSFMNKNLLEPLGCCKENSLSAENVLRTIQSKGLGYAKSTEEEQKFIVDVARKTGVILGPVYTGKALFHLMRELRAEPRHFRGKNILFLHTGDMLSLYESVGDLQRVLPNDEVKHFSMTT